MLPVLLLALTLGQAPVPDFDKDLIRFLSATLKTDAPSTITIERVSQDTLQQRYKNEQFRDCVQGQPARFDWCAEAVEQIRTFVYGVWEKERDPKHLHIALYDRAGIEVIVHEYLHWWLHYRSDPAGLVNTETLVEALRREIMTSKGFIDWLEAHR